MSSGLQPPDSGLERGQDPVTFRLLSHGVSIEIQLPTAVMRDQILPLLPPRWERTTQTPDRSYAVTIVNQGATTEYVVHTHHRPLIRNQDPTLVIEHLASILALFIAQRARGYIFIHCGVVALRGKGLLLPGRSFAGKSSLVLELVRQGATYYSDEFAVLDQEGRVHPYERALALRTPDGAPKGRIEPAHIGTVGDSPIPVGLVALLQYRRGAKWRTDSLSAGPAVMQLLRHITATEREPGPVLRTLNNIVSAAPVISGVRGEAPDAAARLLQHLLTGPEAPCVPRTHSK